MKFCHPNHFYMSILVILSIFVLLYDHHHHPSPELFPCCKTDSLCPLSNNPPFPPPPAPGDHHSTFYLCDFDYSKSLIKVESLHI